MQYGWRWNDPVQQATNHRDPIVEKLWCRDLRSNSLREQTGVTW